MNLSPTLNRRLTPVGQSGILFGLRNIGRIQSPSAERRCQAFSTSRGQEFSRRRCATRACAFLERKRFSSALVESRFGQRELGGLRGGLRGELEWSGLESGVGWRVEWWADILERDYLG